MHHALSLLLDMVTMTITSIVLMVALSTRILGLNNEYYLSSKVDLYKTSTDSSESNIYYIRTFIEPVKQNETITHRNVSAKAKYATAFPEPKSYNLNESIQEASHQGLNAMMDLYEQKEPDIIRKGQTIF